MTRRSRSEATPGSPRSGARAGRGAPPEGGRVERGSPAEVEASDRYGLVTAGIMGVVGLLLLVLAVAGRGWPYLLGAVDFLAIAAVLAWALRGGRPRPGA